MYSENEKGYSAEREPGGEVLVFTCPDILAMGALLSVAGTGYGLAVLGACGCCRKSSRKTVLSDSSQSVKHIIMWNSKFVLGPLEGRLVQMKKRLAQRVAA